MRMSIGLLLGTVDFALHPQNFLKCKREHQQQGHVATSCCFNQPGQWSQIISDLKVCAKDTPIPYRYLPTLRDTHTQRHTHIDIDIDICTQMSGCKTICKHLSSNAGQHANKIKSNVHLPVACLDFERLRMGLRGGICGHAVHLYAASADEILLLGTPGAMVKNGKRHPARHCNIL